MTTTPAGVPEVKIGDWLGEGWKVFGADAGIFILAALIYIVLNCICFPIFYGPLTCGMFMMIFKRMRGEKAEIGGLFAGFNYFGSSFLAGLIFIGLMILASIVFYIGLALCVLPSVVGLALMVAIQTAFLFTFQLIVEKEMSATEAISVSFDKVKENFWQFLLFGFILWLINYAGYAVMLIGALVTVPLILAAAAVAYRDLFGLEGTEQVIEVPEEV
jgi:uncharacterized membrane protein